MTKLHRYKNPPLIQVSASIWWHVDNSLNFEKSKFISGLVYKELSEVYTQLEVLGGPNKVPFNALFLLDAEKQYTLEISSTELKLSSVDENYCWEEFFEHVKIINSLVESSIVGLIEIDHLHAKLEYIDFFKFDYSNTENDLLSYLKSHLNINISSNIFNNSSNINFKMTQSVSKAITSTMSLNLGDKSHKEKGIIINLINDSQKLPPNKETLNNWFDDSHKVSKDQFEKLISGPLKDELDYAD